MGGRGLPPGTKRVNATGATTGGSELKGGNDLTQIHFHVILGTFHVCYQPISAQHPAKVLSADNATSELKEGTTDDSEELQETLKRLQNDPETYRPGCLG